MNDHQFNNMYLVVTVIQYVGNDLIHIIIDCNVDINIVSEICRCFKLTPLSVLHSLHIVSDY